MRSAVARWLGKHSPWCWADLYDWGQRDRRARDVRKVCVKDAANNGGTCWCGKLRGDRP